MGSRTNMETLVTHRQRAWLYLTGGLVLLFLILPVLIVIPMSFSDSRFLTFPPPGVSLRWYKAYFSSPEWMDATRVSMVVAALTTLLATPVGVAAAYGLHVAEARFLRVVQLVLLMPLMVPIIIIAIGVFFVFARVNLVGTIAGLVLAHTLMATPFVVVVTLSGLQGFDMNQEKVARSLGAYRLAAFIKVTLPQIRPSVISGALFAFITSLDEVVIALFISGGENSTITKRMFNALRDEIDPTIAAISSILIVVSLSIVLLALLLARGRSGSAAAR
jgi:putative spermidine/putrescine transport system permease protein